MFNNPEARAAPVAGSAWTSSRTRRWFPIRSGILGGCFVREAFNNPDTWDGRLMFSLATR
jgi:hypothetical protein